MEVIEWCQKEEAENGTMMGMKRSWYEQKINKEPLLPTLHIMELIHKM